MHVIQILLPLSDNKAKPFPDATLQDIHKELMERFGGLTAFTRAPAEGIWAHDGKQARDDIVVVEVMAESLDRDWWGDFRRRVEQKLRQDRLIVRAQPSELL
jgi:hypothetical protein